MKCGECRFAYKRPEFDSYECRRRAPIPVHDPNKHCGVYPEAFVPRWPFMRGDDWCGDFAVVAQGAKNADTQGAEGRGGAAARSQGDGNGE